MRFDVLYIKALLVAASLAQCPLSLIYAASTNTDIRIFVNTPTKEKQSSTAQQRSAIDNNNDSTNKMPVEHYPDRQVDLDLPGIVALLSYDPANDLDKAGSHPTLSDDKPAVTYGPTFSHQYQKSRKLNKEKKRMYNELRMCKTLAHQARLRLSRRSPLTGRFSVTNIKKKSESNTSSKHYLRFHLLLLVSLTLIGLTSSTFDSTNELQQHQELSIIDQPNNTNVDNLTYSYLPKEDSILPAPEARGLVSSGGGGNGGGDDGGYGGGCIW